MKKYLLSLLVVGLSFIGFSNAGTLTVFCDGAQQPCSPTLSYDTSVSNFCFETDHYVSIDFFDGEDWLGDSRGYSNCFNGTFNNLTVLSYSSDIEYPVSITLTYTDSSSSGGGNEGGNTGGSNGSSSSIIPGGSDGLTPAINGLRGTVYQIIPFVIYIGIGVLIAILGFYAIRWLVNWLGGKINSNFSSKRD